MVRLLFTFSIIKDETSIRKRASGQKFVKSKPIQIVLDIRQTNYRRFYYKLGAINGWNSEKSITNAFLSCSVEKKNTKEYLALCNMGNLKTTC
jgi:hypothetical protein